MSDTTTRRMIDAYFQNAEPTLFLTGFFQSPPRNFHDSEEVELDIMRTEEEVAIVVQDLSTGYRKNSLNLFTNKSFKPPIYKEEFTLNAFDLIKRQVGVNPFETADFQGHAISRAFMGSREITNKVHRSIELQASQVLQLGVLTLTNAAGTPLYSLDFKPKATHFPTVGTAWTDLVNADGIKDLESLAKVVRSDGLRAPTDVIFGSNASSNFQRQEKTQKLLDTRRIDLGGIAPVMRGAGQVFLGQLWAGGFKLNMWTYTGRFTDPQSGVSTEFVTPDKVIMLSQGARLDATFGSIPRIVQPEQRVLRFMPRRLSASDRNIDLFMNAWVSDDGENLSVGVGSRPLLSPTAIDTYGCLTTV